MLKFITLAQVLEYIRMYIALTFYTEDKLQTIFTAELQQTCGNASLGGGWDKGEIFKLWETSDQSPFALS